MASKVSSKNEQFIVFCIVSCYCTYNNVSKLTTINCCQSEFKELWGTLLCKNAQIDLTSTPWKKTHDGQLFIQSVWSCETQGTLKGTHRILLLNIHDYDNTRDFRDLQFYCWLKATWSANKPIITEVQRNWTPHLQQTEAHYSFKALCYLWDKDTCTSSAAALSTCYYVALEHLKDFKAQYINPVKQTHSNERQIMVKAFLSLCLHRHAKVTQLLFFFH